MEGQTNCRYGKRHPASRETGRMEVLGSTTSWTRDGEEADRMIERLGYITAYGTMAWWSEIMRLPRQQRINHIGWALRWNYISATATQELNALLDRRMTE